MAQALFPRMVVANSKKVLVVDDDPDIREIICFVLEDEGFDVLKLDNGGQVLQLVCEEEPDVILLDVMLGDKDGRDICKELKTNSQTHATPIIMVSASHTVKRMQCNPDGILEKPFDINELISIVRKFVN